MKNMIENAPALQIDKWLYSETKPMPRHVVRERRVVWNFLKHLEDNKVTPCRMFDGDAMVIVRSKKAVMETLFNLDDARVYFEREDGREGWVYFVLGNDLDVISDYSVGLESVAIKFNAEAYA